MAQMAARMALKSSTPYNKSSRKQSKKQNQDNHSQYQQVQEKYFISKMRFHT